MSGYLAGGVIRAIGIGCVSSILARALDIGVFGLIGLCVGGVCIAIGNDNVRKDENNNTSGGLG